VKPFASAGAVAAGFNLRTILISTRIAKGPQKSASSIGWRDFPESIA
jgi:hypothetical protein